MILGMSLSLFTRLHVVISLIGIASGFLVIFGMFAARRLNALTALFLLTTVLTSITGFLFPIHGVTPGIVLGVLSLIVLAIAILARYKFHLAGRWNSTYVITAIIAQYFNVFVLIAQIFQKVPVIKALAPTGSEPPFKIVMIAVLLLHIVLGYLAVKKFRAQPLA